MAPEDDRRPPPGGVPWAPLPSRDDASPTGAAPSTPTAPPAPPTPPAPTPWTPAGSSGPREVPPEVDGVARRTSPITAGLAMAGVVVGLAMLVAEGALFGSWAARGPDGPPWSALIVPVALVVGAGREVLGWWARTYRVSDDRLVIDEGILTRHHRVVPFERVQQVDSSQTLVQQLLGLAALRIDTAGEGGTTTVSLRLLERRRADGLRSHVLRRRAELQAARRPPPEGGPVPAGASGERDATDPTPEEVLVVPAWRTALAAAAGPPVVVAVVVIALAGLLAATTAARTGDTTDRLVSGGVFLAVAAGAVLMVAMGAVGQVVALWDLRVERVGGDLRLRHGLLEVRTLTVPRRRVQVVRTTDSPLQRWLGFTSVTLHSASAGATQGKQSPTSFTVPHVRRADLDETLDRLLGETDGAIAWSVPALTGRGPRARGRAIRRRVAVGALVGVAALVTGPAGILVVIVGGTVGWLWGLAAHERAGWSCADGLVVLARGVVVHHVELVPLARVQSARTTAGLFQRAAGLATLHVDVAGGQAPHLWDLDAELAEDLRRSLPRGAGAGAQPP